MNRYKQNLLITASDFDKSDWKSIQERVEDQYHSLWTAFSDASRTAEENNNENLLVIG